MQTRLSGHHSLTRIKLGHTKSVCLSLKNTATLCLRQQRSGLTKKLPEKSKVQAHLQLPDPWIVQLSKPRLLLNFIQAAMPL
jgi:hypothetical protein